MEQGDDEIIEKVKLKLEELDQKLFSTVKK
jgi:hypothetical protein